MLNPSRELLYAPNKITRRRRDSLRHLRGAYDAAVVFLATRNDCTLNRGRLAGLITRLSFLAADSTAINNLQLCGGGLGIQPTAWRQ